MDDHKELPTPRTDVACQSEPHRPMTADEVDAQWRGWCAIEVMIRNASVNERISTLERENADLQAKLEQERKAYSEMCAGFDKEIDARKAAEQALAKAKLEGLEAAAKICAERKDIIHRIYGSSIAGEALGEANGCGECEKVICSEITRIQQGKPLGDPFNCPKCGAHDFGLNRPNCPYCGFTEPA